MANDLKLRVLFDFVDKATGPLKNILAGNKGLAKSLLETRTQLKELGKTQKDVAAFRELRTGAAATSTALAAAQAKVKSLATALTANGPPTKAMVRDFEKAKLVASQLKETQQKQAVQLNELRTRLGAAGVETRNLAQHERNLRTNITSTTAAMEAQQAKLASAAAAQKKLNDARSKMQAVQGTASNMAVSGAAARGAGMTVLGDLKSTVTEAKKYETDAERIKALGLGDHASGDAIKYAKAMKMYGTSTTDNISLMRDALSIFADEHHAEMVMPTLGKMKFANAAMFGEAEGHATEEKFMNMLKVIELRGGTASEAKFKDEANMVQQVITATGGRVGGSEWMNFIQTGGVAAKQMRKDAFYYQMEPLIQEMGGHAVGTGLMSGYSNVYQGKTTVRAARQMMDLGLLDKEKVIFNKIGMLKQIKPGALVGGDMMKASPLEWLEKVLLPKFAAKGITEDDQIKDMISTIFTNRTASNLYTTMYMQRAQIHKNERLNTNAENIDQLTARAPNMTTGREVAATAQFRDLKLELGNSVLPVYNAALLAGSKVLQGTIGFMREYATTSQVIITILTVLAGLLVIAGSLTIAVAGVLGPLAILKMSMTTLGIQGTILSRVLGIGAGALRLVGSAIMFVGRALLMNPIGLLITAIALGAYLIYQYWEPIKAFFGGLWDQVRTAFSGGIGAIAALIVNWSPLGLFYQAFAGVMSYFGIEMPAQFTTFGGNLISGLVNGITNGLGAVKTAITTVADTTVGWFKEKLGIHSPSRVFGELGGFISQGAAIGIEGEQGKVAKAAIALATVAAASFGIPTMAAPSIGMPTMAPVPIDARQSILGQGMPGAGAGAGMAAAGAGSTYTITINPAPGMDPAAIARAVSAELDRRERAKQSRIGSRLAD
jgi:hypothetical protein